ncbi:hypothetical protein HAX54_012843, partial [Datura stramonium]|nr:hypothetical protein [Datura stramonium]
GTIEIHILYQRGTRSHSYARPNAPLRHEPLDNIARPDAPLGNEPFISGYSNYPTHFPSTEYNKIPVVSCSGHISTVMDPLKRSGNCCCGSSGYFPNSSRRDSDCHHDIAAA